MEEVQRSSFDFICIITNSVLFCIIENFYQFYYWYLHTFYYCIVLSIPSFRYYYNGVTLFVLLYLYLLPTGASYLPYHHFVVYRTYHELPIIIISILFYCYTTIFYLLCMLVFCSLFGGVYAMRREGGGIDGDLACTNNKRKYDGMEAAVCLLEGGGGIR